MPSAKRIPLLLVLLVGASACGADGARDLPPTIVRPEPDRRVEAWREDLTYLAGELSDRHVAPFRRVSKADFFGSVELLHESIPELDDEEIVIRMARLATSIGDGHTGILLHDGRLGFRPGPLWLLAFEDGVFVKGVVGELEADVLNLRLTRVGGVDPEEALERLAPLIPRDNDTGLLLIGPGYLNLPRVLHSVGLSDEPDSASYVFADAAGNETELLCRALAPGTPAVFRVRYTPGAGGAPISERMRAKPYAFERIGGDALLQYNACRNGPDESFHDFCARVFADLDRNPPRRLVVDLRSNTGGHSNVTRPLLRELRRRPHLREPGRLSVLIGRATFSSGMWAAVDLKREFDAVLVGEPTGGKPNAPGERGVLVLPRSTLECGYSRRLWNRGGGVFDGPSLPPDIRATESSSAHFAGRDAVLEAALAAPR